MLVKPLMFSETFTKKNGPLIKKEKKYLREMRGT